MKLSYQLYFTILISILSINVRCQQTPWKSIGPYMGNINLLVMDDIHPDTIYAATPYGVYKSVDGAAQWTKTSFPEQSITLLEISISNANYLMAATDHSVYLSDNYGESWTVIWSDSMEVTSIAFNPKNPHSLYIGTNEYIVTPENFNYTEWIYKSTDTGKSWRKIILNNGSENLCFEEVKKIIVDPSDTSKIYVGIKSTSNSDGCVIVSHDNGATWTMKNLSGKTWQEILTMAVTPEGYENHCVCAVVMTGVDNCLFISNDNGLTWNEKSFSASTRLAGGAIYISKDYPNMLYIGAKYENGDNHASVVAFNLEEEKYYYLPRTPLSYPSSYLTNNKVDYLGFKNDGVFKYSISDSTWLRTNVGLFSNILKLIPYPDNPEKIYAQTNNYLFKTVNSGETWQLIDNEDQIIYGLSIDPKDTSRIIAGSTIDRLGYGGNYNIYISENGGIDWEPQFVFERTGDLDSYYNMYTKFIVRSPGNPEIIYIGVRGGLTGSGAGLYKSTDNGETWDCIDLYSSVSDLAIDPDNNNIIYNALTQWGYVRRSGDGGESWDFISPSSWVYKINEIAIDNNSQVFALTDEGLLKWVSDMTWSLVDGLQTENLSAIIIENSQDSQEYYVGTYGEGVFVSSDGGSTWSSFNDGLGSLEITHLRTNDSFPKYLYAGTKDGGVWMTKIKEKASSVSNIHQQAVSFNIFPNPNTGSFSIMTKNNTGFKGKLRIINLLGEIIYSENNVEIDSQTAYELNIENITSGSYLLTFTNEKLQIIKRVLIIQ